MALIALAVVIGLGVFLLGVFRWLILVSSPAALLLSIWFLVASLHPDPGKEFDRLFGADHRGQASEIQTFKSTFEDGHFISFRMRPWDFERRIRTQYPEIGLPTPPTTLLGKRLPEGWPPAIQTTTSALYREVDHHEVYLLYFPEQEMAYAVIRYDQW